jgi:hypothetical protein
MLAAGTRTDGGASAELALGLGGASLKVRF